MPVATLPLKTDSRRIVAWALFLPVLCAWPFLSAMPLFTLVGGGLSLLDFSLNAVLLLSGFWPLLVLYGASRVLRAEGAGSLRGGRARGLRLGACATLWTGLSLIIAFARA